MEKENNTSEKQSIPITQWNPEDRPREKMMMNGKKSLTDSELIAILLRTGVKGASAMDLAKLLLSHNDNSLNHMARLEVSDLTRDYKGMGEAKAVAVMAALELGNRMLREEREVKEDTVRSSENLFRVIGPTIMDLPHEEFWAVYLNQRNKVVWKQRIGAGGLTQTTVDLRIIYKGAFEHNAVALAVAHNHPSGNLQPSQADKDLTRRIAEAGRVLSIKLLDHIIVGKNPAGKPDFYSFSDLGLL